MTVNCQHVWREISNYLEGALSPEERKAIERHLAHCRHCSAVLDSTRNILVLVADERTFSIPVGYSERLHTRLERLMHDKE